MSSEIDKLAAAVVGFQTNQNTFVAQDSAGHGYDYLSLAGLLEAVQPELAEYDLSVVQFPLGSGKHIGCETILLHKSGQYMKAGYVMEIPHVPGANVAQRAGAALTYARRYGIAAVCRVAADADTDAT